MVVNADPILIVKLPSTYKDVENVNPSEVLKYIILIAMFSRLLGYTTLSINNLYVYCNKHQC